MVGRPTLKLAHVAKCQVWNAPTGGGTVRWTHMAKGIEAPLELLWPHSFKHSCLLRPALFPATVPQLTSKPNGGAMTADDCKTATNPSTRVNNHCIHSTAIQPQPQGSALSTSVEIPTTLSPRSAAIVATQPKGMRDRTSTTYLKGQQSREGADKS